MNVTSSTFFIPCSSIQASAALYAMKLLKRCTYHRALIGELSARPAGLFMDIFNETVSGNEDTTAHFFLQFNFSGKFIVNANKEGLLLSFYDRKEYGVYHFHQGAAIRFCQALLKCFDASKDVEIAHFTKSENGYDLVGAVNVSKNDFEFLANFPSLVFSPFQLDDTPEMFMLNNTEIPYTSHAF